METTTQAYFAAAMDDVDISKHNVVVANGSNCTIYSSARLDLDLDVQDYCYKIVSKTSSGQTYYLKITCDEDAHGYGYTWQEDELLEENGQAVADPHAWFLRFPECITFVVNIKKAIIADTTGVGQKGFRLVSAASPMQAAALNVPTIGDYYVQFEGHSISLGWAKWSMILQYDMPPQQKREMVQLIAEHFPLFPDSFTGVCPLGSEIYSVMCATQVRPKTWSSEYIDFVKSFRLATPKEQAFLFGV